MITVQMSDEERAAMFRRMVTVTAELRKIGEALAPAVAAAAAHLQQVFATLRETGVLDDEGRLVRRPDRPAWQSPYGPPPRRRR